MVQILAQCFRNFRHAKNLEQVEIYTWQHHGAIITALRLAEFPREIVSIPVCLQTPAPCDERSLSGSAISYPRCIKTLKVDAVSISDIVIHGPGPSIPTKVPDTLKHIKGLKLYGCYEPNQPFCYQCHNNLTGSFDTIPSNQLTTLVLSDMYVNGNTLRQCIQAQTATLREVSYGSSALAVGSCRDIARQLVDLPHLGKINWTYSLFQQPSVDLSEPLPTDFRKCPGLYGAYAATTADVHRFLHAFIEYFHTAPARRRYLRRSGSIVGMIRSDYQEVCLYQPSGLPEYLEHAYRDSMQKHARAFQ